MVIVKKIKQPHWYKMFIGGCPVCGRDASYRVRMYGQKPVNSLDRYEYLSDNETYCGCIR